jgi:hypothetical protein
MKKLMVAAMAVGLWACGGVEEGEGSGTEVPQAEVPQVRIPLEINGQRYSPEEARARFGDRLTGFFVDEEAQAGGFAYAFVNPEEEKAFLQRWELQHPREEVHPQASDTDSIFYEHVGNSGASVRLAAMTAEPDFTRFGCFLYLPCGFWNDKITSVTPSRLNRYTILYQHINYGGVSVRLSNGVSYYDLGWLGFNDMASSASFEY